MDVEVEEFGDGGKEPVTNVYDLEPHLQNNADLPLLQVQGSCR